MQRKNDEENRVIPVVDEELKITRRQVETGRLRVRKIVHEHEELVDEPVIETLVDIERTPINAIVEDEPRGTRVEGDTTSIPVYEEVVQTRLMLREEIRITKTRVEHSHPQKVTLRKEEVVIEDIPIDENET